MVFFRIWIFSTGFFIFFVLLCSSLTAQVVNIEQRRSDLPKSGIQGSVEFSLQYIKNTSELLAFKNKSTIQYFLKKNMFLFFSDNDFGKTDGNLFLNEGFQHVRYNYNIANTSFLVEAFGQFQYNGKRNLNARWLTGLGPRYRIFAKDSVWLFTGILFMYEHERLGGEYKSSGEYYRFSAYQSFGWKFDHFTFTQITYYQPVIDKFSDYRFTTQSAVLVPMFKRLTFKIAFQYNYESVPPPGIKPRYYSFDNSILWKF